MNAVVYEASYFTSGTLHMTTHMGSAGSAEQNSAESNMDLLDENARILVVEDDELVREFAVGLLRSLEYPVASAPDGMEAMRIVEEVPTIDLVFTDIVMPGVDGIVLADMIKQRRPELKILYTTGFRDIARAKSEAGILHGRILEKPYRPAELEGEIRRLLA